MLVRAGVVPVPGFILPEVCLSDAFAQFTDSSSISDGTAGQLGMHGTWAMAVSPQTEIHGTNIIRPQFIR